MKGVFVMLMMMMAPILHKSLALYCFPLLLMSRATHHAKSISCGSSG